jgi:cysteine-rich repeat protein
MTRSAVLAICLTLACSSPDSDLFAPGGAAPGQGGGGGGAAAGSSMSAGSGAQAAGGSGVGGSAEPPVEPECGNGKLEPGEECDDGGLDDGDGCNEACEVDCSDFGEDAVESDDHHCYNGFDEADFEGAQQDCEDRGGHLVTISSDAENDIAQSFVVQSKFIGGFEDVELMDPSAGTYQWVTGEPFTYQNWDEEEDQPDRDGTRCSSFGPVSQQCYEHCARMLGNGLWDDQRCDLEDGYICEWEPAGQSP